MSCAEQQTGTFGRHRWAKEENLRNNTRVGLQYPCCHLLTALHYAIMKMIFCYEIGLLEGKKPTVNVNLYFWALTQDFKIANLQTRHQNQNFQILQWAHATMAVPMCTHYIEVSADVVFVNAKDVNVFMLMTASCLFQSNLLSRQCVVQQKCCYNLRLDKNSYKHSERVKRVYWNLWSPLQDSRYNQHQSWEGQEQGRALIIC